MPGCFGRFLIGFWTGEEPSAGLGLGGCGVLLLLLLLDLDLELLLVAPLSLLALDEEEGEDEADDADWGEEELQWVVSLLYCTVLYCTPHGRERSGKVVLTCTKSECGG